MSRLRPSALVLLLGLLLAAPQVLSQGAIRPMPEPDLSGLTPGQREFLTDLRRQFDDTRDELVGVYLAEAFARLAGFYARFGVMPAAHAAIDNAIAIAPEDGRFPYLKGLFLAREGRHSDARAAFSTARALDPNYLPTRIRIASTELALGNRDAARSALEAIRRERADYAPALALLAEIARLEERWSDAVAFYRAALAADPTADALHTPLAEALAASGDRAGAAAARAKAGTIPVRLVDPLADGVFGSGPGTVDQAALALAQAGRHDEAIALIDVALGESPGAAGLLAVRARIEADRGDAAKARATIGEARKSAPEDPAVLLAEGLVAEIGGDRTAAQRAYDAAIRLAPEDADARVARGLLHQRAGRHADALADFRAATARGGATAWQHVAAAAALARRCGEALRELETAARANPRDGGIAQVHARVAASCPDATATQRQQALATARRLYALRPDASHAETLAMAHAAVGEYDDAFEYQMQAGFELLATRGEAAARVRRPFVDAFRAKRAATTPWPPEDPLMAPPAPAPSTRAANR
jgi:tetratricopeptide (TPR) repeat protein